jgi:hypothetical protein
MVVDGEPYDQAETNKGQGAEPTTEAATYRQKPQRHTDDDGGPPILGDGIEMAQLSRWGPAGDEHADAPSNGQDCKTGACPQSERTRYVYHR